MIANGGEIIRIRPARRIGLLAKIEKPGREGLEQTVGVAEIFDVDLVEIIKAAADRQILRPIIWVAAQNDSLAGLDVGDDIGTGPGWNGETGVVEFRNIDFVARQHRHQRQRQRHFPVADAGQIVADRQRVGRVDRFDEGIGGALLRAPLAFSKARR